MIGFDSLYGFILIFLIPLILWYQHRKSEVREIHVSIFPLLEKQWDKKQVLPRRKPRLSGKQRVFLLSLTIFCLAISINGFHLIQSHGQSGNWFFIMDNTPSTAGRTDDGTILSQLRDRMISSLDSLDDDNRFTLMVTSPKPRLLGNLNKTDLIDNLRSIQPETLSTDLENLRRLAGVAAKEAGFEKIIVISPRAELWRDTSERPGHKVYVPPDDLVLTGNAGFTTVEVLPVGGGFYDLYLRVASSGIARKFINISLRQKEVPGEIIQVDLGPDGNGEAHISEVGLGAYPTTLELDVEDNLAEDNTIRLLGPDDSDDLVVEFLGVNIPAINAALSSYSGFRMLETGGQHKDNTVKVYYGALPEGTIDTPVLVIFPMSSFGGFELKRIWATPLHTTFHPGHPATRNGTMFRSFRPAKIVELKVPENFRVLADAQGIPLIISGTRNNHPVVIWGFDPKDNGLFLDPAFPVLLRDTITWLGNKQQVSIDFPACLSTQTFSYQRTPSGMDSGETDCSVLVREAAVISLPDLSEIDGLAGSPAETTRTDMDKYSLLLAMLFMILLGFDRITSQETK